MYAIRSYYAIEYNISYELNGALKDFLYYYFYANIFNYSWTDKSSLLTTAFVIIKSVGAFSYRNP